MEEDEGLNTLIMLAMDTDEFRKLEDQLGWKLAYLLLQRTIKAPFLIPYEERSAETIYFTAGAPTREQTGLLATLIKQTEIVDESEVYQYSQRGYEIWFRYDVLYTPHDEAARESRSDVEQ